MSLVDFHRHRSTAIGCWSVALTAAWIACPSATVAQGSRPDRPNLLFVLTDDQRYDALGCNGNPIVQTPNVDGLAAQGVSFDRAYVTTSICMISRASVMTGQYSAVHGVRTFSDELTEEQLSETYFASLKRAGYRIGFVGKWGVGAPPKEFFDFDAAYPGQGSYYGDSSGDHLTKRLCDSAEEFLNGCGDSKPFCLSISFKAPHVDDGNLEHPFNYQRGLATLYENAEIPPPALSEPEFFQALPEFLRTSENRIRWEQRFATPEGYQESVRSYYRLVTGVDLAVGRLLQRLEDVGLRDNTVIVYSSDNGFYLGERGFAGKWHPHEVSIRVPLIISDPRLPESLRGRRVDDLALNIDIAPTLLDLAGIAAPRPMQGRSLAPTVKGRKATPRREGFYYVHDFNYDTIPHSEAILAGRYKYIHYPESEPPFEELYDLEKDPDEACNLATDPGHAPLLEDMRRRIRRQRRATARSSTETIRAASSAEPMQQQ